MRFFFSPKKLANPLLYIDSIVHSTIVIYCLYIVLFGFSLMELLCWPQHQNSRIGSTVKQRVLAYGSIMEGPTSEKMRPMVEQSLSHLVMALQDPSVAVRDSDGI